MAKCYICGKKGHIKCDKCRRVICDGHAVSMGGEMQFEGHFQRSNIRLCFPCSESRSQLNIFRICLILCIGILIISISLAAAIIVL